MNNKILEIISVSEANRRVLARKDINFNGKIPLLWICPRTGNYRKFGYVAITTYGGRWAKTKREVIALCEGE